MIFNYNIIFLLYLSKAGLSLKHFPLNVPKILRVVLCLLDVDEWVNVCVRLLDYWQVGLVFL